MSNQILHQKLLGSKKLIALQNQITDVVEIIYEQRYKEFKSGRTPTRPTRTLVYNEALKRGLEFMINSQKPIPTWQNQIYGVLVAPSMFIPENESRVFSDTIIPDVSEQGGEGEEI